MIHPRRAKRDQVTFSSSPLQYERWVLNNAAGHFSSRARAQWRIVVWRWKPLQPDTNVPVFGLVVEARFLHRHLTPDLAKSTRCVCVARFPAEPKNDPIPSTICFPSMQKLHISQVKQPQWGSSCSCLPVHPNSICLLKHSSDQGNTFVSSAALHVRWPAHSVLNGHF